MTCSSCASKVKSLLLALPDVSSAEVSGESVEISMEKHIPLGELQRALEGTAYQITAAGHNETKMQAVSWFTAYKPVLLILLFLTSATAAIQLSGGEPDGMQWMQQFMAGFFLTFSFFKFLDLRGFAESYATYDLLAGRIKGWGFVYPFVEAALGVAFLTGFNPLVTNLVALSVMGISLAGVLRSVLNKQKIRCACLGTVFNLPMSTVTIAEDSLMILMSAAMLIMMVA